MLEVNNTTSTKINLKKLSFLIDKFGRAFKVKKNISLAIVGPARIRSLNRDYRGIDKDTDVLSFTAENEIVINILETKKPKKYQEMFLELGIDISGLRSEVKRNKLDEYLFYFLFVHGLLHLAGYDDKTEKGRLEMIRKGRDFLKKIGLESAF